MRPGRPGSQRPRQPTRQLLGPRTRPIPLKYPALNAPVRRSAMPQRHFLTLSEGHCPAGSSKPECRSRVPVPKLIFLLRGPGWRTAAATFEPVSQTDPASARRGCGYKPGRCRKPKASLKSGLKSATPAPDGCRGPRRVQSSPLEDPSFLPRSERAPVCLPRAPSAQPAQGYCDEGTLPHHQPQA